jgi:DNA-binding transcriptional LysR family regulator
MDLRKLEIFVEAARLESISRAAERLHIAQPAVSIAIARLEQDLGTDLFERAGRRVRLTAEGRRLLTDAASLLDQAAALKASATRLSELAEGELHIACPSMLATYFLPRLLSDFLVNYPGLQASITQAGTADIQQMLLDDELEAGVITVQRGSADAELELKPLLSERVMVLVGKKHSWVRRRYINVAALQGEPLVLYERGYFIRERFDALCREHDVVPDIRMKTNFLPLIIDMVERGIGAGIGLEMMARSEPGLVGIPLRPAITLDLALAKRRNRRISMANQAFMDWLAAS